jgi:hypothetical protein
MVILFCLLTACSRPPSTQPLPSPAECTTFNMKLDGSLNPIQGSDQYLVTISGKGEGAAQITVCFKGKQ